MYDVIIAGAGPAGSTCARECAQEGLRTLLLDRDVFPRIKPCGGAVSMEALAHLGFSLPETVMEQECFGVRAEHSGRSVEIRKDVRFAVLVSRNRFDALLLEKAVENGTRFLPNEHVVDVQQRVDSVEITTRTSSYQALFLIGADGVHSRVAQAIRPPFRKDDLVFALVSHVPTGDLVVRKQLDRTLYVHYGIAPLGYGWVFPKQNYYSVGIAGLASRFQRPRAALEDMARSMNITLAGIRGHYIPLGGIKRKIAGGRVLLVGDAAGFADPLHGEGINHAIHSGKLAAHAVIDAIRNMREPASARARYCREAELRIREPLQVALRMATALEKYPRSFSRVFFDHPEALERYLDIPANRTDYQHYQRWFLASLPRLLSSGRRRIADLMSGS